MKITNLSCPFCSKSMDITLEDQESIFCPYCGEKISVEDVNHQNSSFTENSYFNTPSSSNLGDNVKAMIRKFWDKLSVFGKISTVSIVLAALLCIIAFLASKIFAGVIAIVWIAVVVVALLMKKNVIKIPKTWIPLLVVILSFLLIVPYFSLFKINMADYERYAWKEIILNEVLPTPESPYGEIISNSNRSLVLQVTKTTHEQYVEYIEACKKEGFIIDAETTDSSFEAYSEQGYKLSLNYFDYSNEIHISLTEGRKLGVLSWSESEMAQMLPEPDSTIGEIQQDDEKRFAVYVGNTPIEVFYAYVKACEDRGFTIGADKSEKCFSAKNNDFYKLTVEYQGNSIIYISLDEPEYEIIVEVECVENWIFSKYDVEVYVDGNLEGTIPHGDNVTYVLLLTKGTHTITFESADDDTLDGDVQLEISQNETYRFKISCSSFDIDVKTLQGTTTQPDDNQESNDTENSDDSTSDNTSEITITMGEDDFKGMNFQDAEKIFREMGFVKFKYRTIDTETETAADTICYIEIAESFIGDSDFVAGDKFDADSTITFFYYKYEEPEAPSPVFYSTNDYETAKKGNTGVFAYRNRASSYDIYWIIDFDEGYVYYFTEGNGDSFCDRLKIESGTLNDAITITYHDGGTTWSYKLHFKYVNHPETLIMVDNDGLEWKYSTTDLDDALAIRRTKSIKDY